MSANLIYFKFYPGPGETAQQLRVFAVLGPEFGSLHACQVAHK